jgi:methylase of polypeptide subunit release factors
MNTPLQLRWQENGQERSALWQADNGARLPTRVQTVSDTDADTAYRLASAGTGLLWRGDFQQARQLLQAMSQRMDAAAQRKKSPPPTSAAQGFAAHRSAQALRVRVLGQLLIELDGHYRIALKRAPDVTQACTEAWGEPDGQARVVSLRSLQGLIGAHEWRKKGVPIGALQQAHIHPHHGVFSPVRGEYVDLVAQAPLPAALKTCPVAFDIGVGTGVLSAVLARRGVPQVVATDLSERALACARDNLARLGLQDRITLLQADLFPPGLAALIVCNPPWLPARPTSVLEQAVYDEDSAMLRGFLSGLAAHLCAGGEGWLILSDLAEHLGLRSRDELLQWIDAAGLQVLGRLDTRPRHGKAHDARDPLHAARAAEITSLWRLVTPSDAV